MRQSHNESSEAAPIQGSLPRRLVHRRLPLPEAFPAGQNSHSSQFTFQSLPSSLHRNWCTFSRKMACVSQRFWHRVGLYAAAVLIVLAFLGSFSDMSTSAAMATAVPQEHEIFSRNRIQYKEAKTWLVSGPWEDGRGWYVGRTGSRKLGIGQYVPF